MTAQIKLSPTQNECIEHIAGSFRPTRIGGAEFKRITYTSLFKRGLITQFSDNWTGGYVLTETGCDLLKIEYAFYMTEVYRNLATAAQKAKSFGKSGEYIIKRDEWKSKIKTAIIEPVESTTEIIDQTAVTAPALTKPAVCETCEGTGETSRLHFSGTFGAYEVFSKCPECGGKQIEGEAWEVKADREAAAYLKWLDGLSMGDVLYLKREADGRFMPEWVNVQVTRTSMINIDLVVLQETITKTGEHFALGQEIRVVKRWHSILSGARPLSKSIILV